MLLNKESKEILQKHIVSSVCALLDNDIHSRGVAGSFIRDNVTCEFDFSFRLIDNETGEEI